MHKKPEGAKRDGGNNQKMGRSEYRNSSAYFEDSFWI